MRLEKTRARGLNGQPMWVGIERKIYFINKPMVAAKASLEKRSTRLKVAYRMRPGERYETP